MNKAPNRTFIVLTFKDRLGKYQKALDQLLDPFLTFINTTLLSKPTVFIVEQSGGIVTETNEELFNLGRCANIGFDLIKNLAEENDVFMWHPVDALPLNLNYNLTKTTKFVDPTHLKSIGLSVNAPYYRAIGFLVKDYIKVNGFTNMINGWGAEDDDMFCRLENHNIHTLRVEGQYQYFASHGTGEDLKLMYARGIANWKQFGNKYPESGLSDLSYSVIKLEKYQNKVQKFIIQ